MLNRLTERIWIHPYEEAPGEGVLILGDSAGGAFPDWTVDPVLAGKLAKTLREAAPEICLPGHCAPMTVEEVARDLLEGA